VLAARRFLALEYHAATVADLGTVAPLFAAVTTGDLAQIWTDPPATPETVEPQRRVTGPLFARVVGATTVTRDVVAVDVCRDYGWSGRGTPPTARRADRHGLVRLVVYRTSDPGPGWKVLSVAPAGPEAGAALAACAAWAAGNTSGQS
jgi:hypothetical protein